MQNHSRAKRILPGVFADRGERPMEQTNQATRSTSWTPKRIALTTLAVLGVAAAFWIVFRFRLVFFSLFSAIVLSTAIEPAVKRLSRMGIPRPVSIIIISLLLLALVVFLISNFAPLLIEQWATITSLVSGWYQDLRETLLESTSLLVRRVARQLPATLPLTLPTPSVEQAVEESSLDLVQRAFDVGSAILRSILIVLAVALLTAFWVLDGEQATRLMLMGLPPDRRENIREFIEEIQEKVGGYTRGLIYLSLIIGTMATVSYVIIGLPNAIFLGVIAGIMEAVPLVGPILGAIPAVLVAISTDPSKIIWVLIATAILQGLENNFIVPRVMNRAVGINPVASLLAFIAFGSIFGFVGALLAIPLAAVIQLTLNRFLFKAPMSEQQQPAGRDRFSTLRYEAQDLAQDVRKQVRDKDTKLDDRADEMEDTVEALVQDLDSILATAETEIQTVGRGVITGPYGSERRQDRRKQQ